MWQGTDGGEKRVWGILPACSYQKPLLLPSVSCLPCTPLPPRLRDEALLQGPLFCRCPGLRFKPPAAPVTRSGWDRSPHAPHPSSSTHPALSSQWPGGVPLWGPGCNPGQGAGLLLSGPFLAQAPLVPPPLSLPLPFLFSFLPVSLPPSLPPSS